VNRAVTTLDAIVEGTPYWFLAPPVRANNLLLTIFSQLFSVDHVVSILHVKKVMIAVLHLCLKTEDSKSKDLSDSKHSSDGEGEEKEKEIISEINAIDEESNVVALL
jgi:hypothetical protein